MNGIEAMNTITDRPREMLIRSSQHESDQLLVAVRDSGIGIDSQNLEKIFDAFYITKSQGMEMGWRSAARSLRITAGDCGSCPMTVAVRLFSSH
jgi:signal transduction histidine kinase